MIDLPFRFPWQVAWRCAVAGLPATLVLASFPYLQWIVHTHIIKPETEVWFLLSVGGTVVTVIALWTLLGRNARVWWTLLVAVPLNPVLLVRTLGELNFQQAILGLVGYRQPGPPNAEAIMLLLVPVFLVLLCGHGLLSLFLAKPRPSLNLLAGAGLWLFCSTLVFWAGMCYLALWFMGTTDASEAALIGVLLWLQAFWIGLPWLIEEARGEDAISRRKKDRRDPGQGNAG